MKRNLCVLIYSNPEDETRGKTRRYLNELKPNVFAGRISRTVRDLLWKNIENNNIKAYMVYPDNNEQGFSYKSTMDNDVFSDFDGILLPSKENSFINISDLYAKPSKQLIDHLLEAGYMAEGLLTYGIGSPFVKAMSERFDIPKEDIIQSICFLCALHDIGKAHPGFQKYLAEKGEGEASEAFIKLSLNGYIVPEDEHIRHERYSAEIVKDYLLDNGFSNTTADVFSSVIIYHHQGKSKTHKVNEDTYCFDKGNERWTIWENTHKEIIDVISKHWTFSDKFESIIKENGINGFTYMILSIMVTSDWIVSGSKWDEINKGVLPVKDVVYQFLKDNYLLNIPLSDRFEGFKWETAFDFDRNKLQDIIYNSDRSFKQLTLIECPCGYGKTEAAIIAAIMYGVMKNGIYFAAPTTGTAKGLAKRIQEIAEKAGLDINIPELDSSMIWSDDDVNKILKELWTGMTRHHSLYPFAVGTVDQILKSILSFRYSCIGTLGLSGKAVIIDEVHAYDAYMLEELKQLIYWCRFLNVPVILLSATLPTKTKKELFKAAGYKGNEISNAYPLVSYVCEDKLIEKPIDVDGRELPVSFKHTDNIETDMYNEALSFNKGCLALIQPTVDDAFRLYRQLKKDITDGEVVLYIGRDTIEHKTEKVDKLLDLCGKDRNHRPDKLIIVATSIIEQSLDIDVDKMVTSVAPVDLLIQRMGRIWRHSDIGTVREKEKITDPFIILDPEKYRNLGRIYDKSVLSETEKVLNGITKINTVNDIRKLIDDVYDNADIEDEYIKKMSVGRNVLSSPVKNIIIITKRSEDAYNRFNPLIPHTRDDSYPSETICILTELKDDYTYEEMKKIMKNNVISSVGAYKLEEFEPVETNIKWFKDIKVYVSPDLTIKGLTKQMILTEDGLEFTDL